MTRASLRSTVQGLQVSPTLAVQERARALRAAGRTVYQLGLGQSPFPVPRQVVEALRQAAGEKEYLPVRGLPALREAVADYHRRTQGISASPDDVLIGPGSKELLFLLQLVFDGEVLLPSPAWVSYAPQARLLGQRVRTLPLAAERGFRLGVTDLEAACADEPRRRRLLLLNFPNNPTGVSYEAHELEVLAMVARRLDLLVLSDEIYGELHFLGRHASMARFYPEGTIVSGGLSKWCGAGGWRLGTFVFPAALRRLGDAMAAVASETYTTTSAPIQHAAVRAFRGGADLESYLWRVRRLLGALVREAAQRLSRAGARLEMPAGAFYLFPDLESHRQALAARGITGSAELCRCLLEETGIAALPGRDFGRPADELTLRLALVDFDGARALAAFEHGSASVDEAFLARHCARTLEGVDRLVAWLRGDAGAAAARR